MKVNFFNENQVNLHNKRSSLIPSISVRPSFSGGSRIESIVRGD